MLLCRLEIIRICKYVYSSSNALNTFAYAQTFSMRQN